MGITDRRPGTLLANVLLAAVYFGAATLGLQLAFAHPSATAVWPPTGIALAAVLLGGWRLGPGILAGAFLANLCTPVSPLTAAFIAVGNTLEALLGAGLVSRLAGGPRAFQSVTGVFAFVGLAGLLSSAVSATVGATSVAALEGLSDYGQVWLTWWLGDAVGAILVAPFLILWIRPPASPWPRREPLEGLLLAAGLAITAGLSFGGWMPLGASRAYLCIPFLVWAGLRFGPRGAILGCLVLSALANVGTLAGHGPFALPSWNTSLLQVQVYIASLTVMSLAVAALEQERRLAQASLQQAHDELEARVAERTAELAGAVRQLAAAQHLAHLGSWEFDLSRGKVTGSQELYRILGVTPDTFSGTFQGYLALVHPDDQAGLLDRLQTAALTGAPCSHEYRILQPGGQVRWVQGRVEGILDEQGRLAGLAGTVQDVSERKEAEQALRQAQASLLHSQKMEAAGRLASGLAHDFNNILLAIMLNSNLLGSRPDLDKESRRVLGQIYESAERAAHLTRRLLTFTRKHVASPRVLDLNALVEGLLPMLRRLLGEVAELRVALETRPCLVRADPGQLEQVLVNLLVNARDATPRGGRVTLSTERVQRVLPPAEEAVPCVRLSVCDTGHGMSEDTLARLFEPFFTTKEPGKGTGLGLATVYGIVQESGGDIEVQSRPGQGATFSIYLPRQARAPSPAPAGGPDGPPPAGCETILVAEDEDQVRLALSRLLEGRGYRVLPAASGEEALRVSARYPGSIELLLTDVAMPEMGGVELARRLQALRPGLRVLLVSGHAPEVLARQGVEEGQPLLPKPFSPQALLQRVRESLNSGPGPPRVPEPAEVAADPVPREKS